MKLVALAVPLNVAVAPIVRLLLSNTVIPADWLNVPPEIVLLPRLPRKTLLFGAAVVLLMVTLNGPPLLFHSLAVTVWLPVLEL